VVSCFRVHALCVHRWRSAHLVSFSCELLRHFRPLSCRPLDIFSLFRPFLSNPSTWSCVKLPEDLNTQSSHVQSPLNPLSRRLVAPALSQRRAFTKHGGETVRFRGDAKGGERTGRPSWSSYEHLISNVKGIRSRGHKCLSDGVKSFKACLTFEISS